MRIIFMGTAEFAVPSLYKLIMAGHDIPLVITQPDRPQGRGRKVRPSPVKALAEEFGISIYQPQRIRHLEAVESIKAQAPELIVVVAYGQILSGELLSCPLRGSVNVHASLLPAYRGPAPIQRAIMAGESVTGVTTMYMDETLDTGDIILQKRVPIPPEATFGELSSRLAEVGGELLLDTVDQIQWGIAPRIPQDDTLATYAPLIQARDEVIDWSRNAREIFNQVRALNPQPGASTVLGGVKLKIYNTRVVEEDSSGVPGEVTGTVRHEGFIVQAGRGTLLILEVQREGKRRMAAGDFLKGSKLAPGTTLGL